MRNRSLRRWAWVVPALFLGYLFVHPVARVLWTGLASSDAAPLDVLSTRATIDALWFTTWQATASTLATLLLGLPAAWGVSRLGLARSRWFLAATTVPFVLPTVVVGIAFLRLAEGTAWEGSAAVIVAAHVFYNLAIVIRLVGTRWSRLGTHLEDAARTLGAGPWTTLRRVTLPALGPAIRAASSLVFLLTFSAFGTVLILGDLRLRTLEVEIWRNAVQRLDLPAAATLAILQLVVVLIVLRLQERDPLPPRSDVREVTASGRGTALAWASLAVTGVLVLIPVGALIRSGVGAFPRLFDTGGRLGIDPLEAAITSMTYAAIATVLATVIGGLTAVAIADRTAGGRILDRIVLLPLGTSAVTIGLGFLIALDWPIDLRASRWLVPIAHALVAVPFVTRTMGPALGAVPGRLREAAATLGADPGAVWRLVEWPVVARAAMVGAGFSFAISLGEFGATAFVARPADPTLPLLVYRALGRPGTGDVAAAGSLLLMVVTVLAVLAVDRFRTGEETL